MFKYEQPDTTKASKKQKEIKLLTNYIPIKKANAHSNISDYETETSIQKNFSNKVPKNKNHIQAKSVQTTHNNRISPNKYQNKVRKEKNEEILNLNEKIIIL